MNNLLHRTIIEAAENANVEVGFIIPTEESISVELLFKNPENADEVEQRLFRTSIRKATYEDFFQNFSKIKTDL